MPIIVYKWFKRSNGHLTLQIWTQLWTPCRHHVWEGINEAFWKLHPNPKNSFRIKSRIEKDMGKFFAEQSCSEFYKQVERGWRKTLWAFAINQKSVHAYGVCAVLNVINVRQFLMTSKLPSCHDLKQRNSVNSEDKALELSRFANIWMGTVTSV